MVRLTVIRATVGMPDHVHAEIMLMPVDCNRAEVCKRENVGCIVYEPAGKDPCPEAWE